MTNFKTLSKVLLSGTALSVFTAGSAFAQTKTPADTAVSNTFRLEYQVGGNTAPVIDSSNPGVNGAPGATVFRVDRLVDLSVTAGGDVSVSPGDTGEELAFTVVNEGNDDQGYLLTAFAGGTNTASPTDSTPPLVYYIDNLSSGTVGTLDAADGAAVTYDPANPPVLAPDQTLFVRIRKDFATTEADGTFAAYTLVADTVDAGTTTQTVADTDGNDAATTENVLADGASTSFESSTNGGVAQGDESATAQYDVQSATIVGAKTVSVFNQDGAGNCTFPGTAVAGGYSVPGACVEYVISMTNTGSAAASITEIRDVLPSEVTYQGAQSGGDFTGTPSIVGASVGDDCDAGACPIVLTGVTLPGTPDPLVPTVGTLTIRALIK
jgi:uncharacterized repeat protein (TIGR01451 family)